MNLPFNKDYTRDVVTWCWVLTGKLQCQIVSLSDAFFVQEQILQ